MLVYCIATKAPRGLIIYPRQEVATEKEARIRNTGIDIEQCSINCALPAAEIEAECDHFAGYVFSAAAAATASYDEPLKVRSRSG